MPPTRVVDDLLGIIEKEYQSGNKSITQEKYIQLLKLKNQNSLTSKSHPLPPPPLYPPLFHKFSVPKPEKRHRHLNKPVRKASRKKWTFKNIEKAAIDTLETLAALLDNLHLFSKLPMFPKRLLTLLKHTNRLWVLILLFLLRKTISQLLNVVRREKKIKAELAILNSNKNLELLADSKESSSNPVLAKYDKVLRDLRFDKMMLKFELLGNSLDMASNLIELYHVAVPSWILNSLNFASMAMTVYRMNKDDEYLDDDVLEDLL